MELLLLFTPGLISVTILYILNRVFKYKNKLVSILGTIKYKVALFVLGMIVHYVLIFIYGLNSLSPIPMAILVSYIYLVAVYKK